MRLHYIRVVWTLIVSGALVVSACNGGRGPGSRTFTVGGSVSGLQGSGLVLQDNLGNDLAVTSNGSFVFTTSIAAGAAYSVTVKTQPVNVSQTCTVTAGAGTVAGGNVANVNVVCVTNAYPVGGTVSGLAGTGLVLENNAADDLHVAASGNFEFAIPIASGRAYAVTVKTQPTTPSQTCTPAAASGTVTTGAIGNVTVPCVTNTYTVGGVVNGLTGTGLVLQNNGGDNLAVTAGGAFTFAAKVASGHNYNVTVKTQPGTPAQTCAVSSGAGNITNANISDVTVTCAAAVVQCGQPNGVIVQHANNVVADETWAGAGTTHIVNSTISVMAPATLTIQKCALVNLKAGADIVVRGAASGGAVATLLVAGDDPSTGAVYFNSADTNQPWGALVGENANSHIQLNFTSLSGGGATSAGTRNATIEMHGTSNTALPDPVLKVNNALVAQMQGAGIYFDNAAFTPDSANLSIAGSPDYAMAMSAMALGSIPTYVGQLNTHDEVLVVGNANVFADLTIHNRLPVHFHSSVKVAGGPPAFVHQVTLTLDAGVKLRFENTSTTPSMVTFGSGGQTADQVGTLIANGTALNPITFTSGLDSPTTADYWAGFWLLTSNGSLLQNVIFEFAGADAGIGPVNCGPFDSSINQQARHTAPLLVGDGTDQQYVPPGNLITGSVFRNNIGNFAIDSVWENSTRTFGPSLHNDNVFSSPGKFCPQSKNLIPLGCTISGVDESGCQ